MWGGGSAIGEASPRLIAHAAQAGAGRPSQTCDAGPPTWLAVCMQRNRSCNEFGRIAQIGFKLEQDQSETEAGFTQR